MNYELTKALKAAGFPYPAERLHFDGNIETPPSLSELIEACGDKFAHLNNLGVKGSIGPWEALSFTYPSGNGFTQGLSCGSTPEEAVARLWLALHKQTPPAELPNC